MSDECSCGRTDWKTHPGYREGFDTFCMACGWKKGCHPSILPLTSPEPETVMEDISKDALRERERCVQIVWENRGKCASNQAALALMNEINGRV